MAGRMARGEENLQVFTPNRYGVAIIDEAIRLGRGRTGDTEHASLLLDVLQQWQLIPMANQWRAGQLDHFGVAPGVVEVAVGIEDHRDPFARNGLAQFLRYLAGIHDDCLPPAAEQGAILHEGTDQHLLDLHGYRGFLSLCDPAKIPNTR